METKQHGKTVPREMVIEDKSLKILLVEDNPGDVLIIRELLRSSALDTSIRHVTTLKETLMVSLEGNYDIILLDLGLPDSIGVETLKKILVFDTRSPVVVMTGLDDEDMALESLRQGAQDYIVKSRLNSDILLRGIKYAIERKKINDLLKESEDRYRKLSEELEQKVKERTHDLESTNYLLNQELIEHHLAEDALKKSEASLRELNATKDKFFNIIAHDLKNPFTSLLGSTEVLNENMKNMDTDRIRDLIQVINDSARSGYAVLQNLLVWSRSQTGLITYSPEEFNLKYTIDECIADMKGYYPRKEITLISETEGNMEIYADRNMIVSILRNLVDNAIKFTPGYGTVRIFARNHEGEVTISISDTGIGIPEKNIGELFRLDKKFTRPGTNKEQGTGLGLKICKEFIDMQSGKIEVKSTVNKGSEFIFKIPLRKQKST